MTHHLRVFPGACYLDNATFHFDLVFGPPLDAVRLGITDYIFHPRIISGVLWFQVLYISWF
jgi:hypothetical protein